MAYLFIAHDLSVVRHLSDRIAVMYLGQIVEEGDADEVYDRPTHPYTAALLSSIPVPDPTRSMNGHGSFCPARSGGDGRRAGLPLPPRCPFAMEICAPCRARALPHAGRHHRPLSSAHVGSGVGGWDGQGARRAPRADGGTMMRRRSIHPLVHLFSS